MMKNIVGFSIGVSGVKARFKLSQNRPPADRDSVLEHREKSGHPERWTPANFLRTALKSP